MARCLRAAPFLIVVAVASSMTMAILVLVSAYHFQAPLTFHSVCGVATVLVTTYVYMGIADKLPKPPRREGPLLACLRILGKRRLWETVELVEAR